MTKERLDGIGIQFVGGFRLQLDTVSAPDRQLVGVPVQVTPDRLTYLFCWWQGARSRYLAHTPIALELGLGDLRFEVCTVVKMSVLTSCGYRPSVAVLWATFRPYIRVQIPQLSFRARF